jgi:murein DD-endopeptidase MepM/ murein hydrolase activator NlpD
VSQEYFVVVVAHSLRGRLRRIHIPHTALYAVLALALVGSFSVFGFVASYARMAWKVGNYNHLRQEAQNLRENYQKLQEKVTEKDSQLATLEVFARQVSVAYGIKQRLEGPADIASEGELVPKFAESVQDYNFLRSASLISLRSRYSNRLQPVADKPVAWPVAGRLMGGFGNRLNPFSDEGPREFHAGVDISAPTGTPVKATAGGMIVEAQYTTGGYGRLVVVDHGGGFQTRYAHLSRISVQVGQEVRRGETVGLVGSTGRTTAPHLHYEVRMRGNPVDPYKFMKQAVYDASVKKDFPF